MRNIRLRLATEEKKPASRVEPVQRLPEFVNQLVECGGKISRKVQTDHRPLPLDQRVIFA